MVWTTIMIIGSVWVASTVILVLGLMRSASMADVQIEKYQLESDSEFEASKRKNLSFPSFQTDEKFSLPSSQSSPSYSNLSKSNSFTAK